MWRARRRAAKIDDLALREIGRFVEDEAAVLHACLEDLHHHAGSLRPTCDVRYGPRDLRTSCRRLLLRRASRGDVTTLSDAGCELYACELAMQMFDLERDDLVEQVADVITATDFYALTGDAQIVFV